MRSPSYEYLINRLEQIDKQIAKEEYEFKMLCMEYQYKKATLEHEYKEIVKCLLSEGERNVRTNKEMQCLQ